MTIRDGIFKAGGRSVKAKQRKRVRNRDRERDQETMLEIKQRDIGCSMKCAVRFFRRRDLFYHNASVGHAYRRPPSGLVVSTSPSHLSKFQKIQRKLRG